MSYALVTGASKGIGKAIAKELAKRGYYLLLIGRDEAGLKETSQEIKEESRVEVFTLSQDLREPDAAEKIKIWTSPYHSQLNVVVNNAGHGIAGAFERLSLEEQLSIVDVNIKAQLAITHLFIPILKQYPKSYLLNVCSTTAFQPVPYFNVYAASKAFSLSFNQSLRYELRDSNISLSYLSPGATETDFVKSARLGEKALKYARRFNMTAESVAIAGVNGLFKGKASIIPGFTNKLNAFFPKFLPVSLVAGIAASIYRPEPQKTLQAINIPASL